jgi:WD40 repeat protein
MIATSIVVLAILFAYLYGNFYYGLLLRSGRPLIVEQISTVISAPMDYGLPAGELSLTEIQAMKERLEFYTPTIGAGIVRISEDEERSHIQTIDENGILRKWNVHAGKLDAEDNYYAADTYNTFFNMDGSLLTAPGAIIWDTTTRKRLDCLGIVVECSDPTEVEKIPYGIYVDPARAVYLYYAASHDVSWYSVREAFADTAGLKAGGLNCWDFVNDYDPFEGGARYSAPGIIRIAIDPSGKYIACYLASGVIIIRDWSVAFENTIEGGASVISKEYPYTRFVRYTMPDNESFPKDMSFDSTRTWLSVLTDRELVMWDLRHWFFARKLNVPVSDGNAIAFDRLGKMLALGTKRGITIYDVAKGKQIAEFNVGEVTALYFTRDNRLLVWGDAEGNIHLWGVPKDE